MNIQFTRSPGSADPALSVADAASGHANNLAGYVKQSEFALDEGIHERTAARYRNDGMPRIMSGSEFHIDVEAAIANSRNCPS